MTARLPMYADLLDRASRSNFVPQILGGGGGHHHKN